MFLTKKHLPRRTFLRGIGAAVALPLLDSMIPAAHGACPDSRQADCSAPASSTFPWARRCRNGRPSATGPASSTPAS